MRYFDTVHPAAAAFCFLSVLLVSVFSPSPALQLSALLGGIALCAVLNRGRRTYRDTVFDILLFLLVAFTNPLFVHSGATPLFFLNGNAVTAEAVLCGIGLAVTLLSAVVWFRCFNIIMTSDKLLFLFGRLDFSYYPRSAAGETDIFTAAAIAAFALLSFLPFISEVKEEVRWRYCISKI